MPFPSRLNFSVRFWLSTDEVEDAWDSEHNPCYFKAVHVESEVETRARARTNLMAGSGIPKPCH